jgi:hypothetical protein
MVVVCQRFLAQRCRELTRRATSSNAGAFTRWNGTAPVPVWSGNDDRHA